MSESQNAVEPWLRGTLTEVDPVRRAVLHALQLAEEDVARWAAPLTDEQMLARPHGLPSVAFQLRHMARSLDRLLTYADDRALTPEQHDLLAAEMAAEGSKQSVLQEFGDAMKQARERVMTFQPHTYAESRGVGRQRLPTTVAGLLIHCAEHTQRHAGQLVTTAKIVRAIER